jgi:hypothetical protein
MKLVEPRLTGGSAAKAFSTVRLPQTAMVRVSKVLRLR